MKSETSLRKNSSNKKNRSNARTLHKLTRTIQKKLKFLNWFYNLPIRQKQLIGLFTSELISVVGLVGVGTYLIVTGGRQQLVQQAKSELAVMAIQYDIKIDQMGFGFRGQSDNAAIIAAARARANGRSPAPDLQRQVEQILQNEIQARKIEYATLVGRDLKIIANANTDRTGERFDPNGLVGAVLARPQQIKTSERIDRAELAREAPPLPANLSDRDILIRYTATPVFDRQTGEAIAVLISGDIVNNKFPIVRETLKTLNGGYSAVYLQRPSGLFVPVVALQTNENSSPSLAEKESKSIDPTLADDRLLKAAVAAPDATITGRDRVGAQTYTIAAKALRNYAGEPIAVLVRGTPENALNALLNSSLSTQFIITVVALTADIGLAILLSFALIEPVRRLQRTAKQFASGNLQAKAEAFASDEVGQLTETFNDMADSLTKQNAELAAQAAEQKSLNARLQREVAERRWAQFALQQSETQLKEKNRVLERALQELQSSQAQAIQSEKMSSLGQLMAGVAHEINNPVGFISGSLSHARQYVRDLLGFIALYRTHFPDPPPEIREEAEAADLAFVLEDLPKLLDSMEIGTDRIRGIVSSLRTFSRTDAAEFKAVDIHKGIDNTLMILQHRLKDKPEHPAIRVVKDYGDLPPVECYAGQLNQVFMNILANAIDAIEEANAKRTYREIQENPNQITIRTTIEPSEMPSDWVEIAIADNGPGIPEDVRQHIFDPFFTTKPSDKGTGIGMSISHQIVTEKHGGKLMCFSAPGEGAEFIIQIPRWQQK